MAWLYITVRLLRLLPDFSDVYAYPNPVRPDYTGWITIKGLMDNSLVKLQILPVMYSFRHVRREVW